MNSMAKRMEQIATKDAKIAELGEKLSIRMLEARREEKNFIIYFDTLYVVQNKAIMATIRREVEEARKTAAPYVSKLDSIGIFLNAYDENIDRLVIAMQEDPRSLYRLQQQIINYEQELQTLAQSRKIDKEDLPSWTTDMNIALLSASSQLSAEKSRLFSDLRETSGRITQLTQDIAANARASLARNSESGIRYSLRARRNTQTLLLIAGLLLAYLIFDLPKRIFIPFRKIMRALKAIERGETETPLPSIVSRDEVGELSRSIQEAIHKLQAYNTMKTAKIGEIQRNLHRILEEIKESVFILTPDLSILYINDASKILFDIDRDMVSKSIKEIPSLWETLGDRMVGIERKGRFEIELKNKKRALRKKNAVLIPNIGKTGKLDNIIIIIA